MNQAINQKQKQGHPRVSALITLEPRPVSGFSPPYRSLPLPGNTQLVAVTPRLYIDTLHAN